MSERMVLVSRDMREAIVLFDELLHFSAIGSIQSEDCLDILIERIEELIKEETHADQHDLEFYRATIVFLRLCKGI